jgi:hypothetical protein
MGVSNDGTTSHRAEPRSQSAASLLTVGFTSSERPAKSTTTAATCTRKRVSMPELLRVGDPYVWTTRKKHAKEKQG